MALIGKRIAHFRKERGVTQQTLADWCEMERSAIARLETGSENVTALTLLKLSIALDIRPKDFLDLE